MESPLALDTRSPEELEERRSAEQRGDPFLVYRDGDGRQRIVELDERAGAVTIGRRNDEGAAVPWDGEVSRLHAELSFRAGEWTICDDGWSQNGTWVNGLRLAARRRLSDGGRAAGGRANLGLPPPGT